MIFTQEAQLTQKLFSGRSCICSNWNKLRVNFKEGGNRSALRKPSKSGWDWLKLNPHTTFVVEEEGVIAVHYASLTSQGVWGTILRTPLTVLMQGPQLISKSALTQQKLFPMYAHSVVRLILGRILNFRLSHFFEQMRVQEWHCLQITKMVKMMCLTILMETVCKLIDLI